MVTPVMHTGVTAQKNEIWGAGEPLCGIIRRLPALNIQEMICDGTKQ